MKKRGLGPRIAILELQVNGDGFEAELKSIKMILDGKKHVHRGDEKNLLTKLLKTLDDVDLLVTWGGERFEIPFLTAKAIRNQLNPSVIYQVFHLDLKQFFEKTFAVDNPELGKAAEILGVRNLSGKAETTAALFGKLRPVLRVVRPELAL